jgi:hypothetical protein
MTAGRHGHVPVDQEREAAEHPLLGQAAFGRQDVANPVRQILVVCHGWSLPQASDTRAPRGSRYAAFCP